MSRVVGGARAGLLALLVLGVPAALGGTGCHKRKAQGAHVVPAGSSSAASAPDEGDPTAPRVALIDLTQGAPERRPAELFRQPRGSFYDLIEAVGELKKRDHHAGVFVKLGGARIGWSRAAEAARGLRAVRESGKPVYCHADDVGNSSYFFAAQACDRIWISPAGGLDTVGIAAELVFVKELLGKVGADADVLQVGKFKGTGEMLTRESASDEVKQSLHGALSGIRASWLEGVEAGRGKPELRALLEKGPYAPAEAKAAGLIDEVGYADDALLALRVRLQAGRTEPVYGGRASVAQGKGGGALELVRALSGARRGGVGGSSHVAVLRASGSIVMEGGGSLLGGQGGIVARSLLKQLGDLAEDDATKAVVLRIDSPGGSALASDLIWHELMELRKKKPLIVSVGDMAASGGYYLACAGTKIVAEDTSILGSIGVVGGKLALGGALRRVGVNVEVVPAELEGDGSRAVYESMLEKWDDDTRARVLATMTSIYDLFLRRGPHLRRPPGALARDDRQGGRAS
jgi:protease IV